MKLTLGDGKKTYLLCDTYEQHFKALTRELKKGSEKITASEPKKGWLYLKKSISNFFILDTRKKSDSIKVKDIWQATSM